MYLVKITVTEPDGETDVFWYVHESSSDARREVDEWRNLKGPLVEGRRVETGIFHESDVALFTLDDLRGMRLELLAQVLRAV